MDVLTLSPGEEMFGVDARRRIAVVAHVETVGDFAIEPGICPPMSQDHSRLLSCLVMMGAIPERSVTVLRDVSGPDPASAVTLLDLREESRIVG